MSNPLHTPLLAPSNLEPSEKQLLPKRVRGARPSACETCGEAIGQSTTGRPRRFCCKRCRYLAHAASHREDSRTKSRAYYDRNREAINRAQRERRRRTPGLVTAHHLRYRYGLTPEDLTSLLLRQHGRCAICRRCKPLNVDHDHKTGRVRGLLCKSCNASVGQLGDDVEGLVRALRYLETAA